MARRRKRLTRAERAARKRRAAEQVTETRGNSTTATLSKATQDVAPPDLTETTASQLGGTQELQTPVPRIRLDTLTGKMRQAAEELSQDEVKGIVTSLVADATTCQDPKARVAAVNALVRIAKLCDDDPTKGPETHVHGDVNVTVEPAGTDVLAIAASRGLRIAVDGEGEIDGDNVIDAQSVVSAKAEDRRS